MWLVNVDDLKAMFSSGEITLWCEGREEDLGHGKCKRDKVHNHIKTEREDEVDNIYSNLKERHSTNQH